MQNRFTFKDFVIVLLLVAALLLVAVTIVQSDRTFKQVQTLGAKLGELERRVQDFAAAPRVAAPAMPASSPSAAASTGSNPAATATPGATPGAAAGATPSPVASAAGRGESWARPGVPIQWQDPPSFPTDPRTQKGFREGGEYIEVFEAQPKRLVPYGYSDVYGLRVMDRVIESLADYDPFTMKLKGALADAWQVDPEGLWVRVHINPAARFSDGRPVTAEDVRWTFKDFILDPQIDAQRWRSYLSDAIDDVKVLDERTVEFTFKKKNFLNLEYAVGHPILAKHYYSQFEPSQINNATGLFFGSGPFRMEKLPSGPNDLANQWAPPADVVLVRNEDWWAGRAPLSQYRFRVITNELARLVEYRNGLASMIIPTGPQFNDVLRTDAAFEEGNHALKWVNMRSGYSFIMWQCGPRGETGRLPPFADKRVRQAMTMLLDREKMIRDIWDGIGQLAKGPYNPESPASNPAVKPLPYDPEGAKALLKQAGWEDRNGDGILENEKGEKFRWEFTYAAGGEIAERIARFVKDAYTRAGMICDTRPVDWSQYQAIQKARDFDAIVLSLSASSPESDPRPYLHSESTAKGMDNSGQWKCAAADALIDQGRATIDDEARMRVWQQLEAVIAEEQPYSFIRYPPWLRFIRRDIGNVNAYRTGLVPDEFFRAESVIAPAN